MYPGFNSNTYSSDGDPTVDGSTPTGNNNNFFNVPENTWVTLVADLTAISGYDGTQELNYVKFTGYDDPGTLYFDNVSIGAIPEPSQAGLVIGVIAILTLGSRRRFLQRG